MRKSVKLKIWQIVVLSVTALFLLSIIIAASVCGSIANRIDDTSVPVEALSKWMSYIEDDALLMNIAIPGSHDAGTNGMPWYTKTQSRNVDDQLACGTRYFDLRVKVKKGECRIYHGPAYSLYLKDILGQVRDFLIANSSECVILDVHKFGNNEAKPKTAELLDEYLGGMFAERPADKSDLEYIEGLTIGEARGKCVLIWGDPDEYVAKGGRYLLRNDDHGVVEQGCLQSFYERSWNWYYSSEKYIKKAIPAYIEKYKQSSGGLFVLQCQLTDGSLVMGPRYREGCHEKNMNDYIVFLSQDSETLQYINIVMRDFISPMKNGYTLILNIEKGCIKAECEADYAKMISDTVNDYAQLN